MRKRFGLALFIVLVLGFSSFAFAAEGPLTGGNTISANIDVSATVGPYASVTAGSPVNFGTLLGKVGLYTANGFDNGGTVNEFYHRAALVFGIDADKFVGNNNGWGSFYVESNTDVNVAMSFDNTNWLVSPTLFAVAKEGAPAAPLAWAASNANLGGRPTSFTHAYQVGEKLYGIDGAIWIQSISQQMADVYTGLITITVSK